MRILSELREHGLQFSQPRTNIDIHGQAVVKAQSGSIHHKQDDQLPVKLVRESRHLGCAGCTGRPSGRGSSCWAGMSDVQDAM
jgi:hypothetical protein